MSKEGILLCGHGSRHPDGVSGFLTMAEQIQQRHPEKITEAGFLELSEPSIAEAVKRLYERGVRDVLAAQAFLFAGVHVRLDIPLLLAKSMEQYDGLRIRMASYVGVCDNLVKLGCKRIAEAEEEAPAYDRSEAVLFGVGVRASVSDANGDIAKLNRLIWEEAGFDHSLFAFTSRMAKPCVADAARIVNHLPHQIVVVLPLIFFNGVCLENAFSAIKDVCSDSGKTFVFCRPFHCDDLVLDAIEQRLHAVIDGKVDLTQNFDREKAETRCHGHHHGHDHGHHHGH